MTSGKKHKTIRYTVHRLGRELQRQTSLLLHFIAESLFNHILSHCPRLILSLSFSALPHCVFLNVALRARVYGRIACFTCFLYGYLSIFI
nr:MAG TPA_asm: hypothetical protein [Caudoviricetes sp.]